VLCDVNNVYNVKKVNTFFLIYKIDLNILSYIVLTMPRLPINYQNALIYKFVCKNLDVKECYVGSTTDFRKRKTQHKSNCNKGYNSNLYQFIRDNGGWDNWDMVLVEKYPCDDRLELLKRERYWIEELNASLNKLRPILTTYETLNYNKIYYEENKDEIKNQQKEYYEANKDEKIEYQKKYYEANKDEINEKRKEYNKEYYHINKDKMNKVSKEKYNCECGGKYTHSKKSRHIKSNKHQAYIKYQTPCRDV